jgi:NSS family neurotransmitter:Na+ symporter
MNAPQAQDHWRSTAGFLLASLGSAVGLGNVWRFSYVAGENGGGAFLLVYLCMVLLIGIPLLLAEFSIGRGAQRESASAFHVLSPRSPWRHLGLLGVVVACLILAYYAVIAGWVFKYAALYLTGTTQLLSGPGHAAAFSGHVASGAEALAWQAAGLALTMVIVARGVQRGIERISLALMPTMAVLLLFLALHSASLPGFQRGFDFLFSPDWSVLRDPRVYLAATGQAFFSIGLAMGVMVTYGSYLQQSQHLPRSAATIALGDTLFAVIAGLVIFPAVFSFGLDPAYGTGLAFVALPSVFEQMQGGRLLGAAFFGLLSIAALTSMVSLLEVAVAYGMQRFGLSRLRATLAIGFALLALGVPASLGFGLWAGVTPLGERSILDSMDFLTADLLLPVNGLLLALFLGWVWPRAESLRASQIRSPWFGRFWHFSLRYLAPALVAVVLVAGLARA